MVKNVLITGGAGYIGTSLLPKILNEGYEVTVFDNLLHGGNQLLPFFQNAYILELFEVGEFGLHFW